MPTSVFITRQLSPSSPFLQRLSANGYTVHGASLVTFAARPFDALPDSDWVFFYSPRAVRYFFEQLPRLTQWEHWQPQQPLPLLPAPAADRHSPKGTAYRRIGCIGATTAQHVRRYLPHIDFTGTGDPDTTAQAFLPFGESQRILFPGAATSQRALQRRIGAAITAIDLTVYDNVPRTDVAQRPEAVLVFTSPMNVRAYAAAATWQPQQRIVAIGRSTAAALRAAQCPAFVIADAPDEAALARAVLAHSPKG